PGRPLSWRGVWGWGPPPGWPCRSPGGLRLSSCNSGVGGSPRAAGCVSCRTPMSVASCAPRAPCTSSGTPACRTNSPRNTSSTTTGKKQAARPAPSPARTPATEFPRHPDARRPRRRSSPYKLPVTDCQPCAAISCDQAPLCRRSIIAPQRCDRHRPQALAQGEQLAAGVDDQADREAGAQPVPERGEVPGVAFGRGGGELEFETGDLCRPSVLDDEVDLGAVAVPE